MYTAGRSVRRAVSQDPDLASGRRRTRRGRRLVGPRPAAAGRRGGAARGTAVEIVYATGAVEPVRWAKVASLIRARIVELCDCEGKTVEKGDVLARLDDRELRAQLDELRAREDFLKREMSRVTELIGRGSATTQAFERASMDLRQIQAQISVQMEKHPGVHHRRADGRRGAAPRRRDRRDRRGRPGAVPRRRAASRCRSSPRSTRRTFRACGRAARAVAHRRVSRPAAGRQACARSPRWATPSPRPIRIQIALPDDTPLKPGMSVEANVVTRAEAERAAGADRRRAGRRRLRGRRRPRAQARGRGRHPRHPRGRRSSPASPTASGSPRRSSADLRDGRRVRVVESRRPRHEPRPRDRLDPCARSRARQTAGRDRRASPPASASPS